jgi:hypothetical protein
MRDVTPRDPRAAARILEEQVTLTQFVDLQFKRLKEDAFMLINDVSTGLHNRLSKSETRFERMLARLEEEIGELRRALENGRKRKVLPVPAKIDTEHPGRGNWKPREPESIAAAWHPGPGSQKGSGRLSRMGMKP